LIPGEEIGVTIATGVEEKCATEAGDGCNFYKIIDNSVARSMRSILILCDPGFAAAAAKFVVMWGVGRILDGRKDALVTLCKKVDRNMYSADDVWQEVPGRCMLTISSRFKTRVVPYRHKVGTYKLACTPDELRPDPAWESYFVLVGM
jgi:hypothetical protein